MDLKNMKVSIGIVIAIVVQAFGIIWYVAQLDSTVSSLDSSVAAIQEDATTVDVAVLQTDLENIKESKINKNNIPKIRPYWKRIVTRANKLDKKFSRK